MESEIAGWLSVVFRFVHVLAAIMWIGNSLLFTWMELNLITPKPDDSEEKKDLLGHLDMLHGGGVFHLQKKVINPQAIPVPLHWFMWQSYTTWISGILLLISVFYIHGGAALVDTTKTDLTGWRAIALSAGAIIGWWLVYDTLWKTKLKDMPKVAIPLTFALLIASACFLSNYFNGKALFLQIGAMMASAMTSNVFFHIIQNQKKFMKSLLAGLPHDMKYGKQAKTRSMHNHYMTFPVLFLMLSGHFPQLWSAALCHPHPRGDHHLPDGGEAPHEFPLLFQAVASLHLRHLHPRLHRHRPSPPRSRRKGHSIPIQSHRRRRPRRRGRRQALRQPSLRELSRGRWLSSRSQGRLRLDTSPRG